ncbi:MAG: hypothetical protein A3F09_00960 [Chlamydiae bacterium RIFCSPHIGHO2_12_FULL_49_11]|nr:MAG: hypothetical protein A3F09_00960 [Chlamydiae bacterium RIFCSPHIGHO2_12_FULL_49_11]
MQHLDHGAVLSEIATLCKSGTRKLVRNALTKAPYDKAATNWDVTRQIEHRFSCVLPDKLTATNQHRSGRCWIFAGLNTLRIYLMRKYDLEDFEFSQSYLFYFDKLEKANYFLEKIIETASEDNDSRIVSHLVSSPMQDGGQWDMFASLVLKYGLVPKSVYPDSEASLSSPDMNYALTLRLRAAAAEIRRQLREKARPDVIQTLKRGILSEIQKILFVHMGEPPQAFDWTYYDKKQKQHTHKNLDPLRFYRDFLKIDISRFVCLVHSPRQKTPYNEMYTIDYLGNVIEGQKIRYLNVPIEQLKSVATLSLLKHDPVWFGCDVKKQFHRELGVMEMDLFPYNMLYDGDFSISKEERMLYGESQMTHAMVFTGVHLNQDKPARWRVENSWGDKVGDKGFFIMGDSWFDEYMFEVVVNQEYIPSKFKKLLTKPVRHLPPWDPLGALA